LSFLILESNIRNIKEPWVFGEPYTSMLRAAAMQRYSLLPLWYTVFYEAYSTGMPVMRPMFMEFPEDASTFAMDAQWMVGSSLLVAPVTSEHQTSVKVYLPARGSARNANGDMVTIDYNNWYDLETLAMVPAATSPGVPSMVAAPMDKIPVFIRPGSIVPRKMRLRRSSKLMHYDPLTLVVAPTFTTTATGTAHGLLYLDDEYTLAHETRGAGSYALRSFTFANGVLTCSAANPLPASPNANAVSVKDESAAADAVYQAPNTVERIVIAGQFRAPKGVKLAFTGTDSVPLELEFVHDTTHQTVTVKKPDVRVIDNWSIAMEF
jgi:mannosyl-oligosaccharide alpha-1,3-glucosidase